MPQVGVATLTLSSVLLVPALAGYVGAVRESRVCLILVREEQIRLNLKHIDNC